MSIKSFFACYLLFSLAIISTCLGFVTLPAAGLEDRGLLRGSSIKRNQNETIEHYLPPKTSSISLSATSSIVSFSYQYFTGKTTKYYGTLTNAPTTAMTIFLWVTTSTKGSYIATMGRTSSSIDGEFIFGLNIVGEPWYFDWSSANKFSINITASGYSVTNNQRTFVAFVKSFNIGYLYIDGQRVKQMIASSTVTLNNLAFNVGNDYRDNNRYFVGTMDNFNLYNYAMSASEILTAYQSALPTLAPTRTPTYPPSFVPTQVPTTQAPTKPPTLFPTPSPTHPPTFVPTQIPTQPPSPTPTQNPTLKPSPVPTRIPTYVPTKVPTQAPTYNTNLVSFSSKSFPTSSPVYYSSFTLPPKTGLTLYTWITTSTKGAYIATMGRTSSNVEGEFIFAINSAGELWYMDWTTACQYCIDITTSGYSVTNGQRTFVAVVKNSNVGYLYINGQLVKQATGKGTVTITNLAFNVGYDIRDSNSYFSGKMDNFNFYNYAFSSSDIWAAYQAATYAPTREPTQAPTYDTKLVSFSSQTFPTSSSIYYSSFTLPPKTALTLYTWVTTTKKASYIASMGRTTSTLNGEFIFGINIVGEPWYWDYNYASGYSINVTAAGYSVTNNQRTFVAIVKNANTGYLYIDGQLKAQNTAKSTVTIQNLAFNVGYDMLVNNKYFEGTMDNFNFYNYAFSSAQILTAYQAASPTPAPTSQPSSQPSRQPTNQPTSQPTRQPSQQPTNQPTSQPTQQPSRQPYSQPTTQPSKQPFSKPSTQPSSQPSLQPSAQPSTQPTRQPSRQPSFQPSQQPVSKPTNHPTSQPTQSPSRQPYSQPTMQPTQQPLMQPTTQPSRHPTTQPSQQPISKPSNTPTSQPTQQPSRQPYSQPTTQPSKQPFLKPSTRPSCQPSSQPSSQPSMQPSIQPTNQPITQPSKQPISTPSNQPTAQPTQQPSKQPSKQPTCQPSIQPVSNPSARPSCQPSVQPSAQPSTQPTSQPSRQPTAQPSQQPVSQPSNQPSPQPTQMPSRQPYGGPTSQPSTQPTTQPSSQPSLQPLSKPSSQPSNQPTSHPSSPTSQPSRRPSQQPSSQPSKQPSSQPSSKPSSQPSSQPTRQPSLQPSKQPTQQPTSSPSRQPSNQPIALPTCQPTKQPSAQPSAQPVIKPSSQPSQQPSNSPTRQPTVHPSTKPSMQPTVQPTSHPSSQPSIVSTSQPTTQPSMQPSLQPFLQPTSHPSNVPSTQPTIYPTGSPTAKPTSLPTSQPTTPEEYPITSGEYAAITIGFMAIGGICIHLLIFAPPNLEGKVVPTGSMGDGNSAATNNSGEQNQARTAAPADGDGMRQPEETPPQNSNDEPRHCPTCSDMVTMVWSYLEPIVTNLSAIGSRVWSYIQPIVSIIGLRVWPYIQPIVTMLGMIAGRVWTCTKVLLTATDFTTDILFILQLWREMHCLPGSGCQDAKQRYQINYQHIIPSIMFVIIPVLVNLAVILCLKKKVEIYLWTGEYITKWNTKRSKLCGLFCKNWCNCDKNTNNTNERKGWNKDCMDFLESNLPPAVWFIALLDYLVREVILLGIGICWFIMVPVCEAGLFISCLTNAELATAYYCGKANAFDMYMLGVLFEDFPQLLIQLSYAAQAGTVSKVQFASLIFTIWRLLYGLMKEIRDRGNLSDEDLKDAFNLFPFDAVKQYLLQNISSQTGAATKVDTSTSTPVNQSQVDNHQGSSVSSSLPNTDVVDEIQMTNNPSSLKPDHVKASDDKTQVNTSRSTQPATESGDNYLQASSQPSPPNVAVVRQANMANAKSKAESKDNHCEKTDEASQPLRTSGVAEGQARIDPSNSKPVRQTDSSNNDIGVSSQTTKPSVANSLDSDSSVDDEHDSEMPPVRYLKQNTRRNSSPDSKSVVSDDKYKQQEIRNLARFQYVSKSNYGFGNVRLMNRVKEITTETSVKPNVDEHNTPIYPPSPPPTSKPETIITVKDQEAKL